MTIGGQCSRLCSNGIVRQTVTLLLTVGVLASKPLVTSLSARLIAAEDFEYADACLTAGLNGGFGWAEGWTGENFITVGPLRLAQLSSRGHKLTKNPAPGREAPQCPH